ncbi:MAG: Hsp20/alpha crystallin family protein [Acidobacteria bacterium]|nr:Hsp20/alpha crystallin family protein [Acidobacteriota bacterium]
MAEVTVKKSGGKETEALARRRGLETPFLGGNLFQLNPFALMRRLTEEMDRVFTGTAAEVDVWAPAIEVKQEGGRFLVSAELPGLKKEDVKVQVTGDALILEGERKQEKEEKREGYYRSERSYGRFYRSIPLPEGANLDKASAEFTDGVLEVAIPVPESKQQTREIPVADAPKIKSAGG